jgi:hypothetical protein
LFVGVAVVAGCGRVGFDPRDGASDATTGDNGANGDSGQMIDMPSGAGAPCDAADTDLVLCLRLDGDLLDRSSYANHATSPGVVVYGSGRLGGALQHDAATEIRVPEGGTLEVASAFTIEMWIYIASLPATRSMLFDRNGEIGWSFTPTDVNIVINTTLTQGVVSQPMTLPTLVWQYVAVTYDGNTMQLWIDGAARGATTAGGAVQTGTTEAPRLGGNAGGPPADAVEGAIDHVRVWRIARTPAQIACAAAGTC